MIISKDLSLNTLTVNNLISNKTKMSELDIPIADITTLSASPEGQLVYYGIGTNRNDSLYISNGTSWKNVLSIAHTASNQNIATYPATNANRGLIVFYGTGASADDSLYFSDGSQWVPFPGSYIKNPLVVGDTGFLKPNFYIYSPAEAFGPNYAQITASNLVIGSTGTLGFYDTAPVEQQILATGTGKTVDNGITALQNLGLVRQA